MKKIIKHNDRAVFHKLYGLKRPRVVYYKRDFVDYVLMIALSALAIGLSYGFGRTISIVGFALCAFMVAAFIIRHGIELRVPLILRRPQELLYVVIYKLQNLKSGYFVALGVLLLEEVLIAATPTLPHHFDLMRKVAAWLFYTHFLSITIYRTVILTDHLAKKELVREVLMQTAWKRVIKEETNITLEILHAYCTGVLTHICVIAPWYLVITYCRFSVVFLPAVCLINIIVYLKWYKVYNAWFYRDHWLGHNCEFEFVFLHGPHHDAIPSGLIAVGENGYLEGFLRYVVGEPIPFLSPAIAFVLYMLIIKIDIDTHQYIPGVFPRMERRFLEIAQHPTHHYGPLEPYSIGLKMDQPGTSEELRKTYKLIPDELMNSAKLDEELTGFRWDNPTYRKILSLYDKYHK